MRIVFAFAPAVLFGVVFGIAFGPGAGITTAALMGLAGWDATKARPERGEGADQ